MQRKLAVFRQGLRWWSVENPDCFGPLGVCRLPLPCPEVGKGRHLSPVPLGILKKSFAPSISVKDESVFAFHEFGIGPSPQQSPILTRALGRIAGFRFRVPLHDRQEDAELAIGEVAVRFFDSGLE